MIGHRHGDGRVGQPELQNQVTAPLSNHDEAVVFKDARRLAAGQHASLGNRDLDRGDVDLAAQTLGDLGRTRRLEEQLDGFLQVGAGFLDGVALAGHIDLGTERYEAIAFALDQGRQSSPLTHAHLPLLTIVSPLSPVMSAPQGTRTQAHLPYSVGAPGKPRQPPVPETPVARKAG